MSHSIDATIGAELAAAGVELPENESKSEILSMLRASLHTLSTSILESAGSTAASARIEPWDVAAAIERVTGKPLAPLEAIVPKLTDTPAFDLIPAASLQQVMCICAVDGPSGPGDAPAVQLPPQLTTVQEVLGFLCGVHACGTTTVNIQCATAWPTVLGAILRWGQIKRQPTAGQKRARGHAQRLAVQVQIQSAHTAWSDVDWQDPGMLTSWAHQWAWVPHAIAAFQERASVVLQCTEHTPVPALACVASSDGLWSDVAAAVQRAGARAELVPSLSDLYALCSKWDKLPPWASSAMPASPTDTPAFTLTALCIPAAAMRWPPSPAAEVQPIAVLCGSQLKPLPALVVLARVWATLCTWLADPAARFLVLAVQQ